MGKLDRLPRPGLRECRALERVKEARLSSVSDVGVCVGESSDRLAGGGLLDGSEGLMGPVEMGDSVVAPLAAGSVVLMLTLESSSAPVGESLLGTSKLFRVVGFLLSLETLIGNRPGSGPLERSRRCLRGGAGLFARLRSMMARLRASMAARRLLSSVLIARGRGAVPTRPLD
jgi:hypothetical protein